jgi:hypothetical protein
MSNGFYEGAGESSGKSSLRGIYCAGLLRPPRGLAMTTLASRHCEPRKRRGNPVARVPCEAAIGLDCFAPQWGLAMTGAASGLARPSLRQPSLRGATRRSNPAPRVPCGAVPGLDCFAPQWGLAMTGAGEGALRGRHWAGLLRPPRGLAMTGVARQ